MTTSPAARSTPRIGLIGVGAMGMAMALNLRERGHAVWSRDVRAQADAQASAAGITVCASPRELAAATDIVFVVVVNAAQIDAVLFGADGVVQAPGGARTVVLCSTIAPQDTARFAAQLAPHGIALIDAPISGGPARARAGEMSMMIAAPAATLAAWEPVFAALAAKRFVVGETIGDAAKAKLVNNLMAGINLVAGAEALALSAKLGLDPHAMYDLICASSGASWVFEDRMARALAEDYTPPRAAAHILTKDVGLATAMAASVDHATPLGDAALARLRETVARGWAELDDAVVIRTYQLRADGDPHPGPLPRAGEGEGA
ncbi:MAG: NAD(P)-dependent oxidoreductase [Pseudomonadota bacterium]